MTSGGTRSAASKLLLSPEDRSRVDRVEALARSGADGVGALLDLLVDPSWAVRRAVVDALAGVGAPGIDGLCEVLLHKRDNEARLAAAVDALVASRGDVDSKMIAMASGDAAPPIVCDAVQVLGRRRVQEAIGLLAKLSTHVDDNVAVGSIEALGRIGGIDTVDALIAAVEARHFFRTFPAIDALGRTGDARAVLPLQNLLADPLYAPEAARALGEPDTRAPWRRSRRCSQSPSWPSSARRRWPSPSSGSATRRASETTTRSVGRSRRASTRRRERARRRVVARRGAVRARRDRARAGLARQ